MHCLEGVTLHERSGLTLHGPLHVGAGSVIQAAGGVSLGAGVVISFDCVLWSINHDYEGERLPYGLARVRAPVVIEDYVWLGRNVLVAPGSRIGEGAVVAMGSVVSGRVPPLAVIAGNPARVVKYRSPWRYLALKRQGLSLWYQAEQCPACHNPHFYLTETRGESEWGRWWRWLPRRLRFRLQQCIIARLLSN